MLLIVRSFPYTSARAFAYQACRLNFPRMQRSLNVCAREGEPDKACTNVHACVMYIFLVRPGACVSTFSVHPGTLVSPQILLK